jgi:hypothetical protein
VIVKNQYAFMFFCRITKLEGGGESCNKAFLTAEGIFILPAFGGSVRVGEL